MYVVCYYVSAHVHDVSLGVCICVCNIYFHVLCHCVGVVYIRAVSLCIVCVYVSVY